jgi:hypothetical protein
MRQKDQATIIAISSPTPGKKPEGYKFGINLMPQTASSDEAKPAAKASEVAPRGPTPYERSVASGDHAIEEFLRTLPRPKDWRDDL